MNTDRNKTHLCSSVFICGFMCLALAAVGPQAFAEDARPFDNPDTKFHEKPRPLPDGAAVADWPCFLGPTHNGVCTETKLLKNLQKNDPVLVWETKRGSGYASPSIVGDRLIHFHRLRDQEIVDCLCATDGKRFWQFSYKTDYSDRYGYNDGPRATPLVAGDRVITYGAEGVMHCLSLNDGSVIWKKDIAAQYKLKQDFFGVSTTPLLDGDLLIINIGAPGGPTVAALNLKDGSQTWISHGEGARADPKWGASYSSPVPAEFHGKRCILVFAGGESKPPTGGLLGVDPKDGSIFFSFPFRSRSYESVNAANPVVVEGNRVFISASYETGGALLEIQPDMSCKKLWATEELGTHFGTSLVLDRVLYGFDGRHQQIAQLTAVDCDDGKTLWQERLEWNIQPAAANARPFVSGSGRAALIRVDGAALCLGERGDLAWLELSSKKYNEISHAKLFDAPETWCPPVISHGLLYIVQNHTSADGSAPRLLCYDLRDYELAIKTREGSTSHGGK